MAYFSYKTHEYIHKIHPQTYKGVYQGLMKLSILGGNVVIATDTYTNAPIC